MSPTRLSFISRYPFRKWVVRSPRLIEYGGKALAYVSGILVVAMIGMSTYGTFARYVLREPVSWSLELPRFAFVAVVAFPLAYVLTVGGHTRVEFLTSRLSQRVGEYLRLVTNVVFLSYAVFVFWAGLRKTVESLMEGVHSVEVGIPMWVIHLLIPIGVSFLIMELLFDIKRVLGSLLSRRRK